MKMIKKSILALGVVALAAVNAQAAGISGVNIDGTNYTTPSGIVTLTTNSSNVILDNTGAATTLSLVTSSISGQKDFGQFRVKDASGNHYWYTVIDTGVVGTGDDAERVRQEVFVRANSSGQKGAFFEQQLTAGTLYDLDGGGVGTATGCAMVGTGAATTINNQNCMDIKMNFRGINVADAADRDFDIDFVLSEKNTTGGTNYVRDYQQAFHFGQQQNETTASQDQIFNCQFKTGVDCNGTSSNSDVVQPTTHNGTVVAAAAAGKVTKQVYFNDSLRISDTDTTGEGNLKYEFETVNYDNADGVADDYRYQLF